MRHRLREILTLIALLASGAGRNLYGEHVASLPAECTPRGLAIGGNQLFVAGGAAGALVYSLPDLKLVSHFEPLPIFGEAVRVHSRGRESRAVFHYEKGWLQFVSPRGEAGSIPEEEAHQVLSCLPVDGLAFSGTDGPTVVTLRYFLEGLTVKKRVRELGCGKLGKHRARLRGKLRFTDDFGGLAADGRTALVVTEHKEVRTVSVVDLTDITSPKVADHLTGLGRVESVCAADGVGYVCSGDKGLWIVSLVKYRSGREGAKEREKKELTALKGDIDATDAPQRLELPGGARACAAAGTVALVAGTDSLNVIDIGEIEPRIRCTIDDVRAEALAVGDGLAAATDGKSEVWVYDISDPKGARQIGVLRKP